MSSSDEFRSCVEKASEFKERGNELVKQKQYAEALKQYTKIFLWVNHINNDMNSMAAQTSGADADTAVESRAIDQDITSQARTLRIAGNVNVATCYFRLEQWDKCLDFAERTIALDPNHVRARLRRGQALLRKRDAERAEIDLSWVRERIPTDVEVRQEWVTLQELKKQQDKEMADKYKHMFAPKQKTPTHTHTNTETDQTTDTHQTTQTT